MSGALNQPALQSGGDDALFYIHFRKDGVVTNILLGIWYSFWQTQILIKLRKYAVFTYVCVSECVSVLSLKGHSCLEARCSALIARLLNRRARTHYPRLSSSTIHSPSLYASPSLYLLPPAVSHSLDLISLSQAAGSGSCLLCRNPSAYIHRF